MTTPTPATNTDFDGIRARIDEAIAHTIELLAEPELLRGSARYAALSGGKRLRPMLAYLSARACGSRGRVAMPACVGVELVHAFSLVHDDLPAMDDDDMRRGRPTLHKHAGEAAAILAGDAMLSLACESIGVVEPRVDDATHRVLLSRLTRATREMIQGQALDTLGGFSDHEAPEQRVERIHRLKTASLIRAAMLMGAACAHADESTTRHLSELGAVIGLQFQINDDLLDVEGNPGRVGKALGKDRTRDKLTYPGVFGVARAREIRDTLTARARQTLDTLGPRASGLRSLVETMVKRDA